MVKMKLHQTLGIMVRSDGLILHPAYNTNVAHFDEYWTKGSLLKTGYRRVNLMGKVYLVHRLVAETFIPNPENKPFIDHINQIRDDNTIENLRWATVAENGYNRKDNIPGVKRCDLTKKEYDKIINTRAKAKKQKEKK